MDFNSWNIADLQSFLKDRGVSYSKFRKSDLVELCCFAEENNVEVDPNCFQDNIFEDIKKKLVYDGRLIPNPNSLNYTFDLSGIHPLNHFDIYDYLKRPGVYPSS